MFELLDVCDWLGIFVIDEYCMMGIVFQICDEFECMVCCDCNYFLFILWLVGNEEWVIENGEIGIWFVWEMQVIVYCLDLICVVMFVVFSFGYVEGILVGLEVIGFNYKGQYDIDGMYCCFLKWLMVVIEEGVIYVMWGVYVDDLIYVYIVVYDWCIGDDLILGIEEVWCFNVECFFLVGMFVWMGFDYCGEIMFFGWFVILLQFGFLDMMGVFKDIVFYLKVQWIVELMVYLLLYWNWLGCDGQFIDVCVYVNIDEVELLLNGCFFGCRLLLCYGYLQWMLFYELGQLMVCGYCGGQFVIQEIVVIVGDGSMLCLSVDCVWL